MWSGLFGWAVWRVNQPTPVEPLPAARVLDRPPTVSAQALSATSVDPERLAVALEQAEREASHCGVSGVVSVEIALSGLRRATFEGGGSDDALACVCAAVWRVAWPAFTSETEATFLLAGQ